MGQASGRQTSDIIVNGGSVGSSIATPSPITIDRSLLLTGKGGGIDVLANPINWSGSIAGSGQFVKTGLGTLQLSGVNTYSGGTKITAGTLLVQSDAVLGKAGAPVFMSGGTLEVVMDDDTKDDIVSSRPFVLTGANSSVLVDAHIIEPRFFTVTLNGPVTGGTLNKLGPGTLILNGANAYSKTNIYGGELWGDVSTINGDVTFFGPPSSFSTKPRQPTPSRVQSPALAGSSRLESPGSPCRARTLHRRHRSSGRQASWARRTACRGKSETVRSL